jgi:hypothetical protein
LAGVLFGSTGRTTSGSFAGRVDQFLDSARGTLRQPDYNAVAQRPSAPADRAPPRPAASPGNPDQPTWPSSNAFAENYGAPRDTRPEAPRPTLREPGTTADSTAARNESTPPLEAVGSATTFGTADGTRPIAPPAGDNLAARQQPHRFLAEREYIPAQDVAEPAAKPADKSLVNHAALVGQTPLEWAKSLLALVGLAALALQALRWIGPKPAES